MEKLVYVFWRRGGQEPLTDGAPPWRGIGVGRFLEPDGTDLIRTSECLLHAAAEPSL